MTNTIISISVELASEEIKCASLRSSKSLLDWDIVIFGPNVYEFISSYSFEPFIGENASTTPTR